MTDMREALKAALGHIEHMSAWIAGRNAGYSFESLGEDMPGMRAALAPGEPVVGLAARCREILEWKKTGILCDGELRKLAKSLTRIPEQYRLNAAEEQTAAEAMAAIASPRALDVEEARVRSLLEAIRDNNPNDMAADAVTCGMVWQKEATDILMRVPARSPSLEEMVADEWQSLLDKDDRTSLREFAAAIAKGSK